MHRAILAAYMYCLVTSMQWLRVACSKANGGDEARDSWNQLKPLVDSYAMSSDDKLNNEAPDFHIPSGKNVIQPGRKIDARDSWINFIRRSDNDRKRKEKKKKKQNRRKIDGRELLTPAKEGESLVNVDILMKDFRDLVQKEAEHRAASIIAEKCPECTRNDTSLTSNDIILISRVSSAFYQRVLGLTVIEGYTSKEITSFNMPFSEGAFHRGLKTDFKDGRFHAPRTGIYEFSAILHISNYGKKTTKTDVAASKRQRVHALICIQSLCRQNASLEFVAVLDNSRRIITATIFGLLHLKEQQYVSIHIDNSSPRPIRLQEGSTFTGMLVGL